MSVPTTAPPADDAPPPTPTPVEPRPRASTALVVLTTLAVLVILWAAQGVFLPVLLAMFFAMVGNPVLRGLRRLYAPRFLGALLVLCVGLTAAGALGVQLYGSDPNRPLMDFLARKQANVRVVAPYVYADEAEEPQVLAFIDALVDGELDGLAFTSSPQVQRLLKVARGQGREAELIAAMNARCVAAVGPLVAERLRHAGIAVTLMPESSYFMKPLVRALVEHFAD